MPAQHKRPGRKAREARISRAKERQKRASIIVHFPRRWDPEMVDDFSPGRCVAWADGRYQ